VKRLALVSFLLLPGVAHAQAWTRELGSGYVDLTVSGLSGNRVYGLDFETTELPSTYSQLIVSLYADVGLIDRWLTLAIQSELLRRSQLSDQGATLGLGDTRIGLFSGLVTEPVRLTIGVMAGFPTGDSAPYAGPGADAQANEIARSLPTGDGEWDLEPRILFGWSFGGESWPLFHYLTAWIGYGLRTNAFSDTFTYLFELGTKLPIVVLDRIWWWFRIYGQESFGGTSAPAAPGLGDGVTHTTLALGFHAEIYGGFGVLFSVDLGLRARNIISAVPIRGGLFYNF
jgi:hypothetical protein